LRKNALDEGEVAKKKKSAMTGSKSFRVSEKRSHFEKTK